MRTSVMKKVQVSSSASAASAVVTRVHQTELAELADIEADDAFNVRRSMDEAKLVELAADLARHGQLSPLVVLRRPPESRPKGARPLFLVAGFRRRLVMVSHLGWTHATVLALPGETTMTEALCINLAESANGEPVHVADLARRIEALHRDHGFAFQQIATEVGRTERYVRMLWRLVTTLPTTVREAWFARHPLATVEALNELVPHQDADERWERYVVDYANACGRLGSLDPLRGVLRNRTRKRPTPKQVRMAIDAVRSLAVEHPEAAKWKALALRLASWMHTGKDAPEDVLGPLPRRVGRPAGRRAVEAASGDEAVTSGAVVEAQTDRAIASDGSVEIASEGDGKTEMRIF